MAKWKLTVFCSTSEQPESRMIDGGWGRQVRLGKCSDCGRSLGLTRLVHVDRMDIDPEHRVSMAPTAGEKNK